MEVCGGSGARDYVVRLRIRLAGRDVGRLEQYAVSRLDGKSRGALIALPLDTSALYLDIFNLEEPQGTLGVRLQPISRGAAAAQLLRRSWSKLPALSRTGPGNPMQRMRTVLTALSQQRPDWLDYPLWVKNFDTWSDSDRSALLSRRAEWPTIGVLVDERGAAPDAIAATASAMRDQWLKCAATALAADGTTRLDDVLAERSEDYVAILAAGEVLPPHALALFADRAAETEWPDALYADEDRIGVDLSRSDPHFKPEAQPPLLASGTLTRGIWLFRRDRLRAMRHLACGSAEQLRLELALRILGGERPGSCCHVPFVLCHRRFDTLETAPESLGDAARHHLADAALPARVDASAFPVRVRMRWADPDAATTAPKVSIVVPSAARAAHVTDCLTRVLQQTDYPNFEMIVVVSQAGPLDAGQEAVLAPLRASGKLRVEMLRADRFNYSRANNVAVAGSDAPLICLLNDDVAPIDRDWLSVLVGHLNDAHVAAVGAKLLYPDNTVQHAGVIAGLAGACEHAHRYLPGTAPGYACRAVLDQDVSCVTGACLLVRRDAYDALGGLDETWEVAFNDVDFCLRLREAGWRVVFAASAVLTHYEGASLGHHYVGDREGLGEIEIDRFRGRWRAVCDTDPFHNPNLSLQRWHEWDLAFPPRVARPSQRQDRRSGLGSRDSRLAIAATRIATS